MVVDHRIHQLPKQVLHFAKPIPPKQQTPNVSFNEILTEQQKLKVSKHASDRMKERNIDIPEKLWQTIGEKVQEARQKGITDSLVILNDATLLVSAKNNTVVTALDRQEADNRIFTNIDGTILIDK